MATKQRSSLLLRQRRSHHLPFNRFSLFHSAEVISTMALRLLYYSCFLCLILNTKCDFTMVHASYSEADDLINELDRPSKYTIPFVLLFLLFCSCHCRTPTPAPTNWNVYVLRVFWGWVLVWAWARTRAHECSFNEFIRSRLVRVHWTLNPFIIIISSFHCTQPRSETVLVLFQAQKKTMENEKSRKKAKWNENPLCRRGQLNQQKKKKKKVHLLGYSEQRQRREFQFL